MTYSKNPIRPASKTKMVGQVEFVYSTLFIKQIAFVHTCIYVYISDVCS